jgi:hypothetical protein
MESQIDDVANDAFTKHRCTCRFATVLGSYGLDEQNRFCYKILWRDRIALIYFGAVALRCRDCKRWCRIRILPKERKAEITPMKSAPKE